MKKPKKEFLVIYLWREDTPPRFRWVSKDELKQYDKKEGFYPERMIIRGGEIISDTLTQGSE